MDLTSSGVTHWLYNLLQTARSNDDTQRAALEAISLLASPERVSALLSSLRSSTQGLDDRTMLSYRHALGFDKLTLINAAPSFVLRIHAWWPERNRGTEHIHDHRFVLASAILRGGYDMHSFTPDIAGEPMSEFREQLSDPSADWRLYPVGSAHLRLLGTTKLIQGVSYSQAADTLHQVVVTPETLCLTLFLETAAISSTTRIFSEARINHSVTVPKQILTTEEYLQLLDAVLAEITG
jgi:hypothetical protein